MQISFASSDNEDFPRELRRRVGRDSAMSSELPLERPRRRFERFEVISYQLRKVEWLNERRYAIPGKRYCDGELRKGLSARLG
jgi:hypothetical protein